MCVKHAHVYASSKRMLTVHTPLVIVNQLAGIYFIWSLRAAGATINFHRERLSLSFARK